jgi:hypothetical protein
LSEFTSHGRKRKKLAMKLAESKTYEEWCENAKEVDMVNILKKLK